MENLDEWATRSYPIASGDAQDVDPRELENRIANDARLVIVGMREPWEFRNGLVPRAKLISPGQLQTRYTDALLVQKEFKQVFNVREGTVRWKQREFSLET